MFNLMRQAIDVLKHKVALNLDGIRDNEIRFRKMLSLSKGLGVTLEMNNLLETNKNLLTENFDFINLQISLLKFIEKHQKQEVFSASGNGVEFDSENLLENADLFEQTIFDEIAYNNDHPLFYDEDFFGRIMKHFEEQQEADKCSAFIKAKVFGHVN